MNLFDNQTYRKENYTGKDLPKAEYENCCFEDCNFSHSDLSGCRFTDCSFLRCDISVANVQNTTFNTVLFKGCKMLGVHFNQCNKFGFDVSFEECMLDHSSFLQMKCKNTRFVNTRLIETDFAESDVSGTLFENCDMTLATFSYTNMEKADLRTSFNYSIDPEKNRIRKAKFSLSGLPGLLEKYGIIVEN